MECECILPMRGGVIRFMSVKMQFKENNKLAEKNNQKCIKL